MADKDVGNENVLFNVEDGEGGEGISIEAEAETEVEPVKTATDPGFKTL